VNSHRSFVETDPFAGARIAWWRQDFHEEMAATIKIAGPSNVVLPGSAEASA
jgi:hypothetical protein